QPGRVTYHTPSAHRLHGALNVAAFGQALRTMVQRQPVLRTAIEPDATGARQRIHPALAVELPLEDLSGLPADEREDWLRRRLDALIAEPFDLAAPPLFCARQPNPLPPLAVEYGDFAAWQRQWMQGEELERQLDHWLSRLQGRIDPL